MENFQIVIPHCFSSPKTVRLYRNTEAWLLSIEFVMFNFYECLAAGRSIADFLEVFVLSMPVTDSPGCVKICQQEKTETTVVTTEFLTVGLLNLGCLKFVMIYEIVCWLNVQTDALFLVKRICFYGNNFRDKKDKWFCSWNMTLLFRLILNIHLMQQIHPPCVLKPDFPFIFLDSWINLI